MLFNVLRHFAKAVEGDSVLSLPGVLTPAECQAWIEFAEGEGFGHAPVTTALGPVNLPSVRNNARVIFDSHDSARRLWERLLPHLPASLLAEEPKGLNERLRFYRYAPGQRFAPHCDGYYARPDGSARSQLTLLLYLNQACEGGETRLIAPVEGLVPPVTGSALIFPHRYAHEGCEVRAGRKYVLRSDVMFAA